MREENVTFEERGKIMLSDRALELIAAMAGISKDALTAALSAEGSTTGETMEWDSITSLEISTIIESDLNLQLTAEQSLSLVNIDSLRKLLGG